jgi:hypothetical protein
MADNFASLAAGLDSPAARTFTITKHDTNEVAEVTRALYVGTGGTLAITDAAGNDTVLVNVASGAILPIRVRRVKATGSTAADIVGLA